ncbi:FYVE, RhoGEF and PH domain-containing protein 6-like [Homarus americanus]|uniref:FYVE, RhoGEF and PH domain-containing protein 6-like n=1 Tax=Homarus americanus TaxID=6706 RepID=UPI001C48F23D|nr:FYVE, RhoGEF and PH domain-containing protein 6-like [Homarus americanus]
MSAHLQVTGGGVGVASWPPPHHNNETVLEEEVKGERRRGSWDERSSTTWSDTSDSIMTQESENNSSSFSGRRSLAAIFGSLGKTNKQRAIATLQQHRKASGDGRQSQFYIDLPHANTLVDHPHNHAHTDSTHAHTDCQHAHTDSNSTRTDQSNVEELVSRVPRLGVWGTDSCTSSEQQPVSQSDAGHRRSKTHLGVLVIPASLCESPAYRERASAARNHDSNMGLVLSREDLSEEEDTVTDGDKSCLISHRVPAEVSNQYVRVLAELTHNCALSLYTRNCEEGPAHLNTVTGGRGRDTQAVTQHLQCEEDRGWPTVAHTSESPTPDDDDRTLDQYRHCEGEGGDLIVEAVSGEDGVTRSEECGEGGEREIEEGPALVKKLWTISSTPSREARAGPWVSVWGDGEVSAATLDGTQKDGTSGTRVSEEEGEVIEAGEGVHGHHDGAKTDHTGSLPPPQVSVSNPSGCSMTPGVLCDTNPLTHSPDMTPTASPDLTSDDKRDRKIFLIAQEVMTSERVFVDVLKLLNVHFRKFVLEWREGGGGPVIPEDDLARLLNYLPQLQNLNEEILSDLEERIADWDRHKKISDVIVRKGPFLKLYSAYIKEFQSQCDHLDHCCETNPTFSRVVKAFEATERCTKLNLKHYMLKPVQRIPQYRLLLEEYLKRLPETSPDYIDTQTALAVVSNVAAHANDTMKQGTNFMKLLALQDRLSSSSSTSGDHDNTSSNTGSSNTRGPRYELVRPGRYLLKEGELLKLCRREMQPRYFILLSDVLLYTSFVTSGPGGALRLNCELTLEGMKVDTPTAEEFKNEFSVISTSRSFTLQASTAQERDAWIEALREAIEDNASRRSTFMQAKMPLYQQPSTLTLGKQAPVWIPDYRVTMCQQCTAEFTLTFRRHHCRACGKVVCDRCSANRAPLQYKKHQAARVCETCFEILQKDFEHKYEGSSTLEEHPGMRIRRVSSLKAQFKKGVRDSGRNRIRKRIPERLMEVCASDTSSQMCGYLRMMVRRSWRRGWFVLKDRVLYEYRAPQDVCALQSIPVLGYKVEAMERVKEVAEGVDTCLAFQLTHPNQQPLVFHADTPNLAEKWIQAMREGVVLT